MQPVSTSRLFKILTHHRTHRERKEKYIKDLEQEKLRLIDVEMNLTNENQCLKELLMANGIPFDHIISKYPGLSSYGGSSHGSTSNQGTSATTSTGYTSPPKGPQGSLAPSTPGQTMTPPHSHPHNDNGAVDYDQLGIDFVLTYERGPYLSSPPH